MSNNGDNIGFRRISIITIIAVYLLILAGGIVRSTGSGMGCPDWPRCFGRIIPPTHVSQLPRDYKERYKVHGHDADFNVQKTWIEYINRLLGAVIGILIILVFIYSIPFLQKDKPVFYLSLLNVFLVGGEGWLGKIVVSTNLMPLVVTLHMMGSLVIVAILIYTIVRSQKDRIKVGSLQHKGIIQGSLIALLGITFIQIALGTQIREQLDTIAQNLNYQNRVEWIGMLDNSFNIHRVLSFIILAGHLYFIFKLKTSVSKGILTISASVLLFLIAAEIIFGISLSAFSIPPFFQPLHLLFAALIFGVQFFILSVLIFNKNIKTEPLVA